MAAALAEANVSAAATAARMRITVCPRLMSATLARLERGPRLELEALLPVVDVLVDRDRVAELERPERRVPLHADAAGVAERLEPRLGAVGPDLPRIEEDAAAHRLVALQDRRTA